MTDAAAGITPVDRVNYVNIALMAVSGLLALMFPFYLFLFAYAVLGPLHYLTEISWLHDRNYFLKRRLKIVPIVLATFAITLVISYSPDGKGNYLSYSIMALMFVLAGVTVASGRRSVELAAVLLAAVAFWSRPELLILIGVFLPTLIHVFVFTGMFIFAGNLKSRRPSGWASLGVFIGLAATTLLWHPAFLDHAHVSSYEEHSYGMVGDSGVGFIGLNYFILQMFGMEPHPGASIAGDINDTLYHDPRARALMSFIAYAYTYHYLNWFSKTSVIGWHRTSSRRRYAMLAIWFASLGLYAVDYHLGFRWLFFISLLHVLMELPLNYVTVFAIGRTFMPQRVPRQAS